MNVTPPKPPKMEPIKAKYKNYTASYINDDQMATILIKHKDRTIAKLSRLAESLSRTFTIDEAELEDLEEIYKFLKQRKIKYKKNLRENIYVGAC